tara:strand:+ start:8464 stop:8967 length:504 start_codon:yes stop_codon:yes gene_type:complete
MTDNTQNGRINIMGPTKNQFELFDNPGQSYDGVTSYKDAVNGNWNETALSKTFFCKGNIHIIQNAIRAGVYRMSNGRYNVAPQDLTNLKIIMRSIFLQNAVNRPTDITGQIKKLNSLVLEYCIPNVFNEADAYIKYKNDVSTLAVPLKRPAHVSNKGDKVLELKPFI